MITKIYRLNDSVILETNQQMDVYAPTRISAHVSIDRELVHISYDGVVLKKISSLENNCPYCEKKGGLNNKIKENHPSVYDLFDSLKRFDIKIYLENGKLKDENL